MKLTLKFVVTFACIVGLSACSAFSQCGVGAAKKAEGKHSCTHHCSCEEGCTGKDGCSCDKGK